ncbi:hypothetical protein MRX96_003921 [Rhipicephalus microplus]
MFHVGIATGGASAELCARASFARRRLPVSSAKWSSSRSGAEEARPAADQSILLPARLISPAPPGGERCVVCGCRCVGTSHPRLHTPHVRLAWRIARCGG